MSVIYLNKFSPNFVEAGETELMNLQEGNFARYLKRTAEFKAWQEAWNEKK